MRNRQKPEDKHEHAPKATNRRKCVRRRWSVHCFYFDQTTEKISEGRGKTEKILMKKHRGTHFSFFDHEDFGVGGRDFSTCLILILLLVIILLSPVFSLFHCKLWLHICGRYYRFLNSKKRLNLKLLRCRWWSRRLAASWHRSLQICLQTYGQLCGNCSIRTICNGPTGPDYC